MNNELDNKVEIIEKYIKFMQITTPSQRILGRYLNEIIPEVEWIDFNKTDMAIAYALGIHIKDEHFKMILEKFNIKRVIYEFSKILKKLNITTKEKIILNL